ncbi:MAG: fasciclin domain-containing protein, partial [Myxococcota bacterium]
MFAPASGTVTIGVAQWGGGGPTPGVDACTDNSPYTLYIAVNGEDVDLSAGPTNDDALLGDIALLGTIPEVLSADGRFSILLQAAVETGLDAALAAPGTLTVFAPTDDAFNALLTANDFTLADLLARADLVDILSYHVLAVQLFAGDLIDGQVLDTLNGAQLAVNITADGVFIEDGDQSVAIIETDIIASNGVIHVLDAVLIPPGPQGTCAELNDCLSGCGPDDQPCVDD